MAKRKKKKPQKPLRHFTFQPEFPEITGQVLRAIEVRFTGKIKKLWLAGRYAEVWARLKDEVSNQLLLEAFNSGDSHLYEQVVNGTFTIQSSRLLIRNEHGIFLQKRALRATEADFEQYVLNLVRIAPKVTDGIWGFSLRVAYDSKPSSKSRSAAKKRTKARSARNRQPVGKIESKSKTGGGPGKPLRRDARGRFRAKPKPKPKRRKKR